METNSRSPDATADSSRPGNASGLLDELATDRAVLADRLAAPAWLYPAFGVLTAIYVASPLFGPGPGRRAIAGIAIAATFLLVWGYRRLSGVRVLRAGAPARLTLVLLFLATLLLLSVSLGLASFGLTWWIVLPALASFGLTVALGRLFDRQYRQKVRSGG